MSEFFSAVSATVEDTDVAELAVPARVDDHISNLDQSVVTNNVLFDSVAVDDLVLGIEGADFLDAAYVEENVQTYVPPP